MPQNTNVKKGFKLKKKTLTTDVWSELDGRKLHPPFGSDEPRSPLARAGSISFFGLSQDILGWVNIFLGWLKRVWGWIKLFFGVTLDIFALVQDVLGWLKRY